MFFRLSFTLGNFEFFEFLDNYFNLFFRIYFIFLGLLIEIGKIQKYTFYLVFF
jgi:hypothetical protein